MKKQEIFRGGFQEGLSEETRNISWWFPEQVYGKWLYRCMENGCTGGEKSMHFA